MGCASSSSTQMDAQSMLEKQRQIMEQRQREFELKRQAGAISAPQGGRPAPVSTARPTAGSNVKTNSAPPSPATPLKRQDPPSGIPKLDAASASRPSSNRSQDLREDKATKGAALPAREQSGAGEAPAKSLTGGAADVEPTPIADVETRARKYTVDQNDLNARRSKNVHDFAMYAKDVTRRPSFNPRPSESPFTPEMQAMMKAGHEAMMAAEAEKKMQRVNGAAEPEPALPSFEDEDQKNAAKDGTDQAAGGEGEARTAPEEKPKKEEENFDLDTEEARRKAEAEKAKGDVVPGLEDPNLARFLAKDGHDRKSKNIHDLGQYFNRRASYVPEAPGQQRRASFLPQPGADPARRGSMLPPPVSN